MVVKDKLANGARIITETLPESRSVSIGIWILAGSRNEAFEKQGISHLIEHMMFKGTEKRTAKQIAEAFDSIGGDVNAFTSKEYTCIFATVLDEHAGYAWEVLADMFLHSAFAEEELEREKKVIAEEIDMIEDTPDDVIHDYLHESTFKNHPLEQSILGTKDSVLHISREDLLAYREQYYTAERVVVSVAGNLSTSLSKNISDSLSELKKGSAIEGSFYSTFHPANTKVEKPSHQSHFCLGYPGLSIKDERLYSLSILENVLGGSMSSRLFQQVREERGLAYSIFSYHSTFIDNGLTVIYGGTNPDQLDEMEDIIQSIVFDLTKTGITEREMLQTKEQIKGQLILGLEHTSSRMQKNGRMELLDLPYQTPEDMVQKIEQVSLTDINLLAEHLLNNEPSRALIQPSNV
ncbi:M16 family metallopeptidase [Allobacillus sp. GCM10007491]|uniref:Insulinase family protein n=1 Tax=Allobacillus saliphilus TaxID=2912308 RepID=A0A941HS15_9BACI|nr:pitrilysin family protein [Allobacillus saliphilus]MBR7552938.1 insulinase family protein [Allobacillus saliphilus]